MIIGEFKEGSYGAFKAANIYIQQIPLNESYLTAFLNIKQTSLIRS